MTKSNKQRSSSGRVSTRPTLNNGSSQHSPTNTSFCIGFPRRRGASLELPDRLPRSNRPRRWHVLRLLTVAAYTGLNDTTVDNNPGCGTEVNSTIGWDTGTSYLYSFIWLRPISARHFLLPGDCYWVRER